MRKIIKKLNYPGLHRVEPSGTQYIKDKEPVSGIFSDNDLY
jgi:hypothetical protein